MPPSWISVASFPTVPVKTTAAAMSVLRSRPLRIDKTDEHRGADINPQHLPQMLRTRIAALQADGLKSLIK